LQPWAPPQYFFLYGRTEQIAIIAQRQPDKPIIAAPQASTSHTRARLEGVGYRKYFFWLYYALLPMQRSFHIYIQKAGQEFICIHYIHISA
jgi:hypothetical protein